MRSTRQKLLPDKIFFLKRLPAIDNDVDPVEVVWGFSDPVTGGLSSAFFRLFGKMLFDARPSLVN